MVQQQSTEVLRTLDKAQTQSYHFKAIIISGMGFFTDAYDLFVISTVTKLLGRLYYYDPAFPTTVGTLPANVNAAVTGVALCGTLVGQLFFGWAGDAFGRKKVYGITLAVMVITSIGQGLSLGNTPTSVMTTICFFRFWLGFGIGGDYPLSATIMSEYSNTQTRGAFVAAVFAMQGFGILSGGAVTIMVSAIFKHVYPRQGFDVIGDASTARQADFVWRIVLMFGAVPAALTFYSRSKMPETPRYTALVAKDYSRVVRDMEKVLDTNMGDDQRIPVPPPDKKSDKESVTVAVAPSRSREFGLFSRQFVKRHGLHLLGTCSTWFLLDIGFYSSNLFQNIIFTAVGWLPPARTMSALEETYKIARAQALIALLSTVPGYWFTVAFVDKLGRKTIQLMGFFMMFVFMLILTLDFNPLRGREQADGTYAGGNHIAFVVLYSFTFFFSNFGPNATTFIVPAELFPARLRSTCHGISSAAGKAGAIVGAFGFLYASQDAHNPQKGYPPGIGVKNALLVLAITNALGFAFTLLIPETKGKSLEDLSGENDEDNDAVNNETPKEKGEPNNKEAANGTEMANKKAANGVETSNDEAANGIEMGNNGGNKGSI